MPIFIFRDRESVLPKKDPIMSELDINLKMDGKSVISTMCMKL